MRLGTVLVRGPSMEPVLRDGDCLLVLHGARVRPGAVVVARFLARPHLLVVKRAVRAGAAPGTWHLASDNTGAPGAASGAGDVAAVVLLRWWPLPPRRVRRRAAGAGPAAGPWEDGGSG